MSKESDGYEEFIADLIMNLQVVHRDIRNLKWGRKNVIEGASGQPHQIDISFIDHSFARPRMMLIECKRYRKPIDLEHVKVVLATSLDIWRDRHEAMDVGAVLVSTNGERKGARRFAAHYGIALEVTDHAESYSFRYENIVQAALQERVGFGARAYPTVMRICSRCNTRFEAENGQKVCRRCDDPNHQINRTD
jgi:hypothetical protein